MTLGYKQRACALSSAALDSQHLSALCLEFWQVTYRVVSFHSYSITYCGKLLRGLSETLFAFGT